jgi:hypothetical protein
MGDNNVPAYVIAATAANSMPLLYSGQEEGLRKRLRCFDKDTIDWSGKSQEPFYAKLFALRRMQPALANGLWGAPQLSLEVDAPDKVFAFTRTKGENSVLVATNFSDATLSAHFKGMGTPGEYTDWFSDATVTLAGEGTIETPAHGCRVLVR